MRTCKKKPFLKSSLSVLAVLCGIQQSYSMEVENCNNQQGHKRRVELSVEPNDLITAYPQLGERIADYLQFYDLCSMELVCKTFATSFRNALHYQVLTFDHENKNGWQGSKDTTSKDNFLSLKNSDSNFGLHLSDLWRKSFAFKAISGITLDIPLSHYWEKPLTAIQKAKINSFYQEVDQLSLNIFTRNTPLFYKSIIGKIVTTADSDRNYTEDRQVLTALINHGDKNCLLTIKGEACLQLAIIDYYGWGGPANHANARRIFWELMANIELAPQDRATARLMLATMNHYGLGASANKTSARQKYMNVVANKEASPQDRATAQLKLAEMDYNNRGAPVNHANARQGFIDGVTNNALSPRQKATAEFWLAKMELHGEGGPINPTSAYHRFNDLVANNEAAPEHKAYAQSRLAEMDVCGEFFPEYHEAYHQDLVDVVADISNARELRAKALLLLTEIAKKMPVDPDGA